MEGTSFIGHLREIRSNLRDSIRSIGQFETKLVGPRPSEGNAPKEACESVATLLGEIGVLSSQLMKALAHQHEIIGDFTPTQAGIADASLARYA
ncbi:MAG TPA: hypothetical protein VFF64_06610 [Candidatus Eremiobacteraceae bacterium]|nr:hypothetical protein [Candidatus Eremiobacteraceae bacterium]